MAHALLGLGSNLGPREANIRLALLRLGQHAVRVKQVSALIETEPEGGPPGQGRYLNGAALVQTDLTPQVLLATLLEVERSIGRVRPPEQPLAPRTIDLDLLFYEQRIIHEPGLMLPHPRLHERLFVLLPLVEIAPEWWHPVLGKTVAELLAARRR